MRLTAVEIVLVILATMGAMMATAQSVGEQPCSLVRSSSSRPVPHLVKPESPLVPARVVALPLPDLAVQPVIHSVVMLGGPSRSGLPDR